MNNDTPKTTLARLNGIDPDSPAWVRWCEFIGTAGVERALSAARKLHRKFTSEPESLIIKGEQFPGKEPTSYSVCRSHTTSNTQETA